MKLRTLLLISFILFPAFHAYASDVVADKNVLRDTNETFCINYIGDTNKVALIYPTQQGLQLVGAVDYGSPTNCTDLFSLATEFQDPDNIPWGEGLEVLIGDLDVNPNFETECTNLGQADGCQETVAGFLDRYTVLRLRQTNSILGAQSGSEYVAAVAENTGVTIDDFYPVAAAALGLLLAFVVLGYIMGLFKDDTPELLEKTKRLSREVDEHIEKTTESYKGWNRRLPDLFR